MQIVFFDWNNTLLDDLAQGHEALRAIFDHCGKPTPSIEEYVRAASTDGNWNTIFTIHGITLPVAEIRSRYIARYLEVAHEAELAAHALESLERLRHADREVHIITAAREELARPVLQRTGVIDLCDDVHYYVHDKAEQVREIVQSKGIPPHRTALVGDMRSDIEHAIRAGAHAVAVHSPHVPKELFADLHDMRLYALDLAAAADYLLAE